MFRKQNYNLAIRMFVSVEFKNKIRTGFVENGNHFFQIFKGKQYNVGKRTTHGKMYPFPKIRKSLFVVGSEVGSREASELKLWHTH